MSVNGSSPPASVLQPRLNWACAAILALGLVLIAVCFPQLDRNGLRMTVAGGPAAPVTWLWVDAVTANQPGATVSLDGSVWIESAGAHAFEIVSDGAAEVWLNGQQVYARAGRGPVQADSFTADLPAGPAMLSLRYQLADPPTPRYEVSLRQNGGLIAPWRLFGAVPTPGTVQVQRSAWWGTWIGLGLLALGGALACGLGGRALGWAAREWAAVAGIVALAVALRVVVVVERYSLSPHYYAMDSVWDNFVALGRSLLTGSYELAGSYYQQGAILYTALAQIAVGPGLWPQYALNAALGGLACGWVLGGAWAMFGRGAGLLAGLIMALYAPLIHFQTTLQIVVPATLATSAAVALGGWLVRQPNWGAALAYGIALGVGALCRSPLMGAVFGGPAAILLSPAALPRNRRLLLALLPLAGFALTVAPMAWANAQVGVYSFTSSGFPIAFFRGNNRDTFGINEYMTEREHLARLRAGDEDNFNSETWRDIRADPGHWAQLMIHKIGLFWTGHEYSDRMFDFYSTGLAHSAVLRVLWLGGAFNLYALGALAIVGLTLGWNEPARPGLIMLAIALLGFMALTVLFSVTGRVRTPIHPALFPLAALGLAAFGRRARTLRARWRPVSLSLALAAAFVVVISLFDTRLPRPTTVPPGQLPATLITTNVEFDSRLRLIGYDAYDSDFKPGGYLDLTLYWQALQPLDADYTVILHLLDPALVRLGGVDQPLGAANMPVYPSSHWRAGEIVRQSYLLRLPQTESAIPIRILAALADPNGRRLPLTASDVETLDGTAAFITGAGVFPATAAPVALPRELGLEAGSLFAIQSTSLPATLTLTAEQNTLDISFGWIARRHPAHHYHLFLHLLDSAGGLVAQWDGPPVAGFPTDSWPPARRWLGQYTITLPPGIPAGFYQLTAGLYHVGSLQRLPLGGEPSLLLPDDRFLLAMIEVAP